MAASGNVLRERYLLERTIFSPVLSRIQNDRHEEKKVVVRLGSETDITPDFTLPAEPLPGFHCKRCHTNIANQSRPPHDKVCGGFAGECWPWCNTNYRRISPGLS